MKEIILPPHLYDRIKASAGEHGGIGRAWLFDGDGYTGSPRLGAPHCAHGHAWGTCTRFNNSGLPMEEPELAAYLKACTNDRALMEAGVQSRERIPFERWCELLNVKRGEEPQDDLMIKRLEKSVEQARREPIGVA